VWSGGTITLYTCNESVEGVRLRNKYRKKEKGKKEEDTLINTATEFVYSQISKGCVI